MYSHELRRFKPEQQFFDRWEYDPTSQSSTYACVDEIARYVKVYLIPFFERANSCRSALPELLELEQRFSDKRNATPPLPSTADMDVSHHICNLHDSVKYYMALKNGNYLFALESRKALERLNAASLRSMDERGYLTEKDRARREQLLAVLRKEIAHLEQRDTAYFQQLIRENEAYSRKCLARIICN